MTDLVDLGSDVDWPDNDAVDAMRARLSTTGQHGRLDELAEWLAGVQRSDPPQDFVRARIVVFGGAGCTAEVADLAGATMRAFDTPPAARPDAIAAGIAAGAAAADEEIDSGADLLIVAFPGIDSVAAIVVSVLTDVEPVKVMPRGVALDPDTWIAQATAVRDQRRTVRSLRDEPAELLAALGATELAAAGGFMLRAAARRTPVLLDGLHAATAALVAYQAQPRAVRWWRAADLSAHPAHELALTRLGQRPILGLGIGLGDGTAGALATVVLRAAVRAVGNAPS